MRTKSLRWTALPLLVGALACARLIPAFGGTHAAPPPPAIEAPADNGPSDGASIAVSVPAGSLVLTTSGNAVVLHRRPGNGNTTRYEGVLPRVQVTDTRAVRLGWLVQVAFAAPSSIDASGARIFVHPGQPQVISGDDRGVWKGHPEWADYGSQVSLFSAEQDAGGGTYTDDAKVVLVIPRSDAASITLTFDTSVF